MDSADSEFDFESGEVIRVVEEGEYTFVRDDSTGVSSQGPTKADALENLAAALRNYDESVDETEDTDGWL